jgi:5-hydroxyisourate hydrolase-like protein (transthyretin family)
VVVPILLALAVLSAFSTLPALSAQTRATGRVLNGDSVPLAGIRVVLHRVGQDTQGPIDSTRSDRDGRFRFSFHADTAAFYLVSGRYAGIEYFSNPVATNPHRPDSAVTVVVYDTSSNAPVVMEARHLVVTRPGENGDRGVLDLVILKNTGRRTRIASDSLHPSWSIPLPSGTIGLDVGESDISAGAVARRGDSLLISAAISPGEKQLTLQYEIPAGTDSIRLAIRNPGVTINVLAEEPGTKVAGPGLALADSQVIQGRSFRRWTGRVSATGVVRIAVPRRPTTPRWVLYTLVGALGLGLAAAAWRLLARKPGAQTHPTDSLVSAIAELDARYLGRQEEVGEEEWQSYQTRRAQLKAELEASLAGGGWSP